MLVAGSNIKDINVLKRKLAKSFAMKDLGAAKQILGMRITRDRKNCKLTFVARVFTLACANEHLLRNLDSLVAVQ